MTLISDEMSNFYRRMGVVLNAPVTVTLTPRDDGGLSVSSDELPGLILSGRYPQVIMGAIIPAVNALRDHDKATS